MLLRRVVAKWSRMPIRTYLQSIILASSRYRYRAFSVNVMTGFSGKKVSRSVGVTAMVTGFSAEKVSRSVGVTVMVTGFSLKRPVGQ